jgi:ferredoxin
MSRSTWLVALIKKTFSGRFTLARTTRLPVVGSIVDSLFFRDDRMVYLPMDRVVQVNKKLDEPSQSFLPSAVAEHFVRSASQRWVMNECICRSASHCEDYPVGLGCLFLGEAAAHIDPGLGRPVSEAEALEHLKKCREAGLVHMIGRDRLDAVWLGVSPGHKLMTVCSCCPCCCLWKMLPALSGDISSRFVMMPGVTVSVSDACAGCGRCAKACFLGAIRLVDGRAVIGGECRGCGRCADVCPNKAIAVSVEGRMGEAVAMVSSAADIS